MDTERLDLPSASKWARYELCFGSYRLELEAKRLGQEAYKTSPEASQGERIHAYLAGEMVDLSDSEKAQAEFLRERAADQAKRIFGDEPFKELKEKRLWLKVDGEPLASGRVDRLLYSGRVALVQDYKTGFREPDPAEDNAQLKFLSVCAALAVPGIISLEGEVIAQIISGPYGVTETRFNLRQLAAAYDDILVTLKAINAQEPSFNPGPKQCRYCPAVLICQATKDLVKPVAVLQLSALPEGDRAAKLLDECELLERHIDAIRAYYSECLKSDPTYQLPGWNMVPGPGRREVKDWRAARALLSEFVDAGELDALSTYSIPSVEKLVAKALKLKAKEAAVKLAEILGELLTLKPGNLCLKRTHGEPKALALVE